MNRLQGFVKLLIGSFTNEEQLSKMSDEERENFPAARHVNSIVNDDIVNLPEDIGGYFILEESYYTLKGKTNSSPHLFLFSESDGKVKLTSYDLPQEIDKSMLTKDNFKNVNLDFAAIKPSEKFVPAIYEEKDGVWEGGSESWFTPSLKFKLYEKFSKEFLEVSESMEMNGKRTFGFDLPIVYKRV